MLGVVSHCCSVRIKRTIASLLYCSRFVKQNKKKGERNNQSWQWRPSLDGLVPLFAYHHSDERLLWLCFGKMLPSNIIHLSGVLKKTFNADRFFQGAGQKKYVASDSLTYEPIYFSFGQRRENLIT